MQVDYLPESLGTRLSFPDMNSRSARMHKRAIKVLPGGNTRHTTSLNPYPVYAVSGKGCYIRDLDGVERLDCINNASALIHGHSHPVLVEAVQKQAGQLFSTTMPTEQEVELAEILCSRVKSMEQLRFTNSGTEAVMFAVMAARAYTGREKIAKIEGCYNGSADFLAVSLSSSFEDWGPVSAPNSTLLPGTPKHVAEDVVILPLTDTALVKEILVKYQHELAAIIINPIMTQLGHATVSDEFLNMVRTFTKETGSLFIMDEVYSFRLGYHGTQGKRDIEPDITTLGKMIGGGLPVGAFGGKAQLMESLFDARQGKPKLQHSGTFCGNPMTMTAGCTSMKLMTRDVFEHLDRLGERVRKQLKEALQIAGVPGLVRGEGSVLSILLSDEEINDYRSLYKVKVNDVGFTERAEMFYRSMLNEGVLIGRWGNIVLSTPMTYADIDRITDAALVSLKKLKVDI